MAEPLIVGLGKPLRRDDGVGYLTALELQERGFPAIAVLQPLPELALELAKARIVLFLDGDVSLQPGQIHLQHLEPCRVRLRTDLPPSAMLYTSHQSASHSLGVEGLLELSKTLTGQSPAAYGLSMGIADTGYGEGFSPQILAAYNDYLKQALHFLEHHARTEPGLELAGPR